MLNADNKISLLEAYCPLQVTALSQAGSFACRRALGEGYFDQVQNRTYVAWNEKGMDIYLAYYDHAAGQWSSPECVWQCDLFGRWEYHDYVTLLQDTNGQPMFMYHIHSKMAYLIKKGASGTWERSVLSEDQNDYPAPICYGDAIYYFYSQNREISYPYRPLRFRKSLDNGTTWTPARDVIDTAKQTPDKFDEVYQSSVLFAPACGQFPDRFLLSYTMWGGKAHADRGKGSFCVAFYPQDDLCYDLDGNLIGETVDYQTMLEHCCPDQGKISPCEAFRFQTCGPLPSYDAQGNAILFYGLQSEDETGLFMATRKNGQWQKACLSTEFWNIKDAQKDGDAIELAICHGDCVVLMRREHDDAAFIVVSQTKIPHANQSDCVPYLNFISGNQPKAKLLLGLMHQDDIAGYCDGKWPVLVLSQEK